MVGCIRYIYDRKTRCKEIIDLDQYFNQLYNINKDTVLVFYEHTIKEIEDYINRYSDEITKFKPGTPYTIDALEDLLAKKIVLVSVDNYIDDVKNIVSLYKQLSKMYNKTFIAYGIIYQ